MAKAIAALSLWLALPVMVALAGAAAADEGWEPCSFAQCRQEVVNEVALPCLAERGQWDQRKQQLKRMASSIDAVARTAMTIERAADRAIFYALARQRVCGSP